MAVVVRHEHGPPGGGPGADREVRQLSGADHQLPVGWPSSVATRRGGRALLDKPAVAPWGAEGILALPSRPPLDAAREWIPSSAAVTEVPHLRQHLQGLFNIDALRAPLNFFNGMPSFRNWVALACTVDFRSFVLSATSVTQADFSQVSINCCTVGRAIMRSALLDGFSDCNHCIIHH